MSSHTHVVHSRSLLTFLDPMRAPREEREKSKGTYSYLVYNTRVSPTVRHPALAAQQHDFFVFSLAATLTSTIHASPSFCALRSFRGRLFRLYIGNHRCFDSLFACSVSLFSYTLSALVYSSFYTLLPLKREHNSYIVDAITWNCAFYSRLLRRLLPAALAIVCVTTYLWLNENFLLVENCIQQDRLKDLQNIRIKITKRIELVL